MHGMQKEKVVPAASRDIACSDRIFEEIMEREHGAVGHLSAVVDSSWQRCIRDYKLDRERPKGPEIVTEPEFKTAADPLDQLAHVARPELERLTARLAMANYVVMLSDPNGIALDVLGAGRPNRALRNVGVCAGALWGENHAGTNGIGTSLAARAPVTIHRAQHFFPTYEGLTCTATPIFDCHGGVLAALDASSLADLPQEMQSFVLDLVLVTAHRIERRYFLERNQGRTILRIESGLIRAQEGQALLLALDDNGRTAEVYGSNDGELGLPEREALVGTSFADVMQIDWQDVGHHHEDPYVERIGIARLKNSDRPWFASLMAPRKKSRTGMKALGGGSATSASKLAAAAKKLNLDLLAGRDPLMREHVDTIRRLVDKRLPILLQGETGTGKEEFARGIHEAGARAAKPFVVIDCSSIPESLIESELFGYETGTFTGARREGRRGRIAEANGGTLFLDEIGDMPLPLQTRLLRVLAQGEVVPLGSAKPMKVDFNVICASHQDLPKMVADGRFRQDLYYRIAGIRLELPPLREREDKVDVIEGALEIEAAHMGLADPPPLTDAALRILLAQRWPGNMRELRLAMRYALACTTGEMIESDRLPNWLNLDVRDSNGDVLSDESSATDLLDVLQRNNWCISDAACELRVSRQTLYRWIKRQNLSRPA